MRVNPNSDVPKSVEALATKPKPPVESSHDQADLVASARLSEKLKAVPEVRADKVAAARALIADPSFPGDARLEKVAGILSNHIKPGTSAD